MSSILDLTYRFFNRGAEAQNTKLGTWIDLVTDEGESNFAKTKDNFIILEKEAVTFKAEIIGNSVETSFTISHGLNKTAPRVSIFHRLLGKEMFPEVKIIDSNNVTITFLQPLKTGVVCDISIH